MGTLLTWMVVGLISGWLATAFVGGPYGIVGDSVVGMIGAVLGGFILRSLRIAAPFHGLASTIFVAFVGAVVLLAIPRLLRRGAPRLP